MHHSRVTPCRYIETASKPLIVDTGEERAQLYKLAARCGLAPDAVARAVVDCGGDLDTVASLLLGQQQAPSHHTHIEVNMSTRWLQTPADGTTSPPMLSGPSSFAFSSLQEGTVSPASGPYSPGAMHRASPGSMQPHSPVAMQPPSPGTPHGPAMLMHHALFAPPSPTQASSWSDDPWANTTTNNNSWAGTQLGGGLWGPPMGREVPPPPPRAFDVDGAPQAALMAAAQVGLDGFEDSDLHTMMAALMCG